jgi:hypothetical protein
MVEDFLMDSVSILWFKYLELPLNALTILVSAVAVVYWVRLFRRISLSESRDEGWLWIFSAILMVLLLNISALLLTLNSGRVSFFGDYMIVVNSQTLDFMNTFSRGIMAFSMAVGTYLLYNSMRAGGNVKFEFKALDIKAEEDSLENAKFKLNPGRGYIVVEEGEEGKNGGMELFTDLVTHGVAGLCASRKYPPRVRADYGLHKTPIIWLSEDKDFKDRIHPSDLIELSHTIKDFIQKGQDTVVLVEGIEYLIMRNGFDDVLKLLQGLNDVVVKNSCRLIVALDPSTVSESQYHLLSREFERFSLDRA